MRSCNSAQRANLCSPPQICGFVDSGRFVISSRGSSGIVEHLRPRLCVRRPLRNQGRRASAYLTVDYGHDNPGTLVDVEVANAALVVTQSDLYPPGSPTLTGVVTEVDVNGADACRGCPGVSRRHHRLPGGKDRHTGVLQNPRVVRRRRTWSQPTRKGTILEKLGLDRRRYQV